LERLLNPSATGPSPDYQQTRTGYAESQEGRKGKTREEDEGGDRGAAAFELVVVEGRRKQVIQVSSSYPLPQVVIRVELLI
jgi:hypothetical protein